jgi:predicted nuclease of predicted toxin-antitoxin system
MTYKFLIDECLSPTLVQQAVKAGYVESTCVRDRGLSGTKDWELVKVAVDGDFTLVTHNAVDFRGDGANEPGGHYSELEIHAGLVCLNSVHPMSIARQRRLFQLALEFLAERTDLVNASLELFEDEDGAVHLEIYDIPSD